MAKTVTMSIEITLSQLRRGERGSVLAPIWISLQGAEFPMADWWDFPVVVLSALVAGVVKVGGEGGPDARCHFLDGPFHLRLHRAVGGVIRIEGVDTGPSDSGTVLGTAELTWDHLARKTEDAAARLLEECDRRHWDSPDINALKLTLESLRAACRVRGPN
jgi:hypothetical protein